MTDIQLARSRIDICWKMIVLFVMAISASLLPEIGMAAPGNGAGADGAVAGANAITTVFCNVVLILNGTTGKAVATVAVIAVGVGALLGKISWGMALIVAVGIALIFGASSIVTTLGGNNGSCFDLDPSLIYH